jgi:hypothetical protein
MPTKGHVQLGVTGDLRDYVLVDPMQYHASPANPMAPRLNTGEKFAELAGWAEWVQQDWPGGVGQQDRVGAAELAIKRAHDAGHAIRDAVAYSDSFFPFADGPLRLIQAGVYAMLATSGSIRDQEVKDVCIAHDTPLLLLPDNEARGFFGH